MYRRPLLADLNVEVRLFEVVERNDQSLCHLVDVLDHFAHVGMSGDDLFLCHTGVTFGSLILLFG